MDFNNREVAILIWIAIFLSYSLSNKTIKDGFSSILMALKPVAIWGPLLIGSLWISLLVLALKELGFWDWSNLKTTVFWAFAFAFYSMFQAIKIDFDSKYCKHLMLESFGLSAILMFIGSVYTLSLLAELLILPFALSLSLMQVISAKNPKQKSAHNFVNYLLSLLGLGYISYWGYSIYHNPQRLFTFANFGDFMMPIILTIWYMPYLYLWKLIIVYELLFVALNRNIENAKLLRFSKLMAILNLKWSFKEIDQFKKRISTRSLTNKYDVLKQLQWVRLLALKEKYITEDTSSGWAPRNAMSFLAENGLEVKSYSEPFDNDWHGSASKKLKSGCLFSSLNYSIDGEETQVKNLKLTMSLWESENISDSEIEFIFLGLKLMEVSSKHFPSDIIFKLSGLEEFEDTFNFIFYKFYISQWKGPKHKIFDYILEIKISEPSASAN